MKNNIFCTISLLISSVTLTAQELLPLPLRQKEELKARSWVRETPFEQVIVKEIGNRISTLNVNPKTVTSFSSLLKTEVSGSPKMAAKPIPPSALPFLPNLSALSLWTGLQAL